MNNEFPEQHMLLSVCTTQQSQRLSRSCCTCTPGPVCNIRINCCSSINVRTLTIPIYVRTKKKLNKNFHMCGLTHIHKVKVNILKFSYINCTYLR